jgi:hypothetical protein
VEEPLPSAANTGNNEANMALLVLPEWGGLGTVLVFLTKWL